MKIAVPQIPIYYHDWCDDCCAETHHYIVLMTIEFKIQRIKFYYYCNDCFKSKGNNVMCFTVVVPYEEWDRLLGEDMVSNN